MVSAPGWALAWSIASEIDPAPKASVVVTVKVSTPAEDERANAQTRNENQLASAMHKPTLTENQRQGSEKLSWFRCEKTLVNKRGHDQDHRHAHEGADAVKLVEVAQVVQEQFRQRDTEQRDAGIARGLLPDPHANQDEPEAKSAQAIE